MSKSNICDNKQIKLSIIVTIYNREKYLEKCINSILNQTFNSFELILVNDGSTDRSADICDKYANLDSRVRVIHKKNGGVSSARNVGIDNSNGEYIGFVDSDDYIKDDMYEIMYTKAKEFLADIVICRCIDVKEDEIKNVKKKEKENIYDINVKQYNNKEALNEIYTEKNALFISPVNKLYKKTIFDSIRYEINRIHEDDFIAHRLLYKAKKIIYIDKALYFYTISNDDSIMRSSYSKKRLDSVYALNDRVKFFKEKKEKDLFYLSQRYYIEMFIGNYYKARTQLNNINQELSKMKKDFNKQFIYLYKNPYYNWKEKILLTIFTINPTIYKWYINRKNS